MAGSEEAIECFGAEHPLFEKARAIRRAVFVEEQNVPEEEEWDARDAVSTHMLIRAGGEAAGTLRFFDDGGVLHIGRVAVLRRHRSRGLGAALMRRAHEEGRRLGFAAVFLTAQTHKADFYEHLGYRAVGGVFAEAGIDHIRMERDL